jgi:hypothetical protein
MLVGLSLALFPLLGGFAFIYYSGSRGTVFRAQANFEKISRVEECGNGRAPAKKSRPKGLEAFEKWARAVRAEQGQRPQSGSPAGSSRKKSEKAENECAQMRPGETLFAYRKRKLMEGMQGLKASLDEDRGTLLASFSKEYWVGVRERLGDRVSGMNDMLLGADRPLRFIAVEDVRGLRADGGHSFWVPDGTAEDLGEVLEQIVERENPLSSPGWAHTLFLEIFRAPIAHGRSFLTRDIPKIGGGATAETCERFISDPGALKSTARAFGVMKARLKECDGRASCSPGQMRQWVSLSCVLKGPAGSELRRETRRAQWPDLPALAQPDVGILWVPEDYLESARPDRRARLLRVFYELSRLVEPSFIYDPTGVQLATGPDDMRGRLALLEGTDFDLARLGAADFFNPFEARGLPKEALARVGNNRLRRDLEELIRQFRLAYASHHRGGV